MKYKLIAMDFDGTLLNDNKEVSRKNYYYLKKAQEKTIIIVGVTARTLNSVIDVLDINIFDYLILNNGAYIYDVKSSLGTSISTLDRNIALSLTELVKDNSFQIDYCSPTTYYVYKGNPKKNLDFIKSINSLNEVNEEISRMNIFLNENTDINKLKDLINSSYQNINCFIMQDSDSVKKWLVVNPNNLNKKVTLENLAKKLNIDIEDVVFFGDGLNDLEVISSVGLGVAMGNALKEVKDNSKDITLSNNDSGIAYYIKKKIL
jgi:hypothetical protein